MQEKEKEKEKEDARREKESVSVGKSSSEASEKPKLSGFERGLVAEEIKGAIKVGPKIMFLMKWKGTDEEELVFSDIARYKCPPIVIKYYEERLRWSQSGKKSVK